MCIYSLVYNKFYKLGIDYVAISWSSEVNESGINNKSKWLKSNKQMWNKPRCRKLNTRTMISVFEENKKWSGHVGLWPSHTHTRAQVLKVEPWSPFIKLVKFYKNKFWYLSACVVTSQKKIIYYYDFDKTSFDHSKTRLFFSAYTKRLKNFLRIATKTMTEAKVTYES